MESAVYDRMIQLCALAAVEQDSQKLLVLVEEINRLLDENQLNATQHPKSGAIIEDDFGSYVGLKP